jgi:hypothetical protein
MFFLGFATEREHEDAYIARVAEIKRRLDNSAVNYVCEMSLPRKRVPKGSILLPILTETCG